MGKILSIYNNFKTTGFRPRAFFLRRSMLSKKVILIIASVILFAGLLTVLFKSSTNSQNGSALRLGSGDLRYELPSAKAVLKINKEYTFPLKDEKGAEVSRIKYVIENVELRDQIVVKGQKATSVKGRTFLIINIKIANDFEKAIDINTKDYIRLSVNGNESELLAPDIHNDPVTIQAISTKYSRVGFPINDTDKNLKLKVGEINGEKQTIDLKF